MTLTFQEMLTHSSRGYKSLPSPDDIKQFQFVMGKSASAIFNAHTGLPSRSSPVSEEKFFDYAIDGTVEVVLVLVMMMMMT